MFWPFTVWGFLKPNFKPHEYWISRTCCCNSTYRLRYWNSTSSLTKYGKSMSKLQQYLPLAVLKPSMELILLISILVATVLTACGIETYFRHCSIPCSNVATVLTACGIETRQFVRSNKSTISSCNSTYRLRYWNLFRYVFVLLQ